MRQTIFRIVWIILSCALTVVTLAVTLPMVNGTPADRYAPSVTLPEPPPADQPELPENPVDFAALQAEFPEAAAWIRIPETAIDYAVMRSGTDTPEDFYLDHNEKGEKDRNGSIYMQRYNHVDFSDPNTVLYGHNMSGGKMFGGIHKFKKAAYFNEHEYLYVYTPGHVLTYRIYALFDYGSRHLLWAYDFDTEEGFQQYINKTLKPGTYNRLVREGVTPTTADRLLTLSTCQNSGDGRLLLVAVLESDTETK